MMSATSYNQIRWLVTIKTIFNTDKEINCYNYVNLLQHDRANNILIATYQVSGKRQFREYV